MRIGVIASVGSHFDAFWVPIAREFEKRGHDIYFSAGTDAKFFDVSVLSSITRKPSLRSLSAPIELRDWAQSSDLDIVITNRRRGMPAAFVVLPAALLILSIAIAGGNYGLLFRLRTSVAIMLLPLVGFLGASAGKSASSREENLVDRFKQSASRVDGVRAAGRTR